MKAWYLSLMEEYRQQIVNEWVQQVSEQYPNSFHSEKMRENGLCYLHIIEQLHIPVEEHPDLEYLPKIAKKSIVSGIPITRSFHICKLFRRILFSAFNTNAQHYCSSSIEIEQIHNTLVARVDYLQKIIHDIYSEHSQSII